jgi:hypothetical protein
LLRDRVRRDHGRRRSHAAQTRTCRWSFSKQWHARTLDKSMQMHKCMQFITHPPSLTGPPASPLLSGCGHGHGHDDFPRRGESDTCLAAEATRRNDIATGASMQVERRPAKPTCHSRQKFQTVNACFHSSESSHKFDPSQTTHCLSSGACSWPVSSNLNPHSN